MAVKHDARRKSSFGGRRQHQRVINLHAVGIDDAVIFSASATANADLPLAVAPAIRMGSSDITHS